MTNRKGKSVNDDQVKKVVDAIREMGMLIACAIWCGIIINGCMSH